MKGPAAKPPHHKKLRPLSFGLLKLEVLILIAPRNVELLEERANRISSGWLFIKTRCQEPLTLLFCDAKKILHYEQDDALLCRGITASALRLQCVMVLIADIQAVPLWASKSGNHPGD